MNRTKVRILVHVLSVMELNKESLRILMAIEGVGGGSDPSHENLVVGA
jgi:hypothetical protein